jgi:hypothetical protein
MVMRLQECPCGSGEWPEAMHDGYGIFLCYACGKCKKKKMMSYRGDIGTNYECDEPIEEDY